jgi:hypothetical protein
MLYVLQIRRACQNLSEGEVTLMNTAAQTQPARHEYPWLTNPVASDDVLSKHRQNFNQLVRVRGRL